VLAPLGNFSVLQISFQGLLSSQSWSYFASVSITGPTYYLATK
jgi:hypothetical protein